MTTPTKAELQDQLTGALADRHSLQQELLHVDGEARALDGCIHALNGVQHIDQAGSLSWGSNHRPEPVPDPAAIRRVLLHVAARFDVDLVERETLPCDRFHLDDATDEQLVTRLRGGYVMWAGPNDHR